MNKETVIWSIVTAVGSLLGAAGGIITGIASSKVVAAATAPKVEQPPVVPESPVCPPETK